MGAGSTRWSLCGKGRTMSEFRNFSLVGYIALRGVGDRFDLDTATERQTALLYVSFSRVPPFKTCIITCTIPYHTQYPIHAVTNANTQLHYLRSGHTQRPPSNSSPCMSVSYKNIALHIRKPIPRRIRSNSIIPIHIHTHQAPHFQPPNIPPRPGLPDIHPPVFIFEVCQLALADPAVP